MEQPDVIHLVDWMREVDMHIFDVLALREEFTIGAKGIALNIDYNRVYVNRRCHELVEIGVLELADKGYFRLTSEAFEAWRDQDVEFFQSLSE